MRRLPSRPARDGEAAIAPHPSWALTDEAPRDEGDVAPQLRGRAIERLRLFVDAYRLPLRERPRAVDALLEAHAWCHQIDYEAVVRGHETFGEMWRDGGRANAVRSRRWIAEHESVLRQALSGP